MEVADGLHRVTGTLVPDATGDFLPHVISGGKISYRRTDGAWFIYWSAGVAWVIGQVLGVPPAPGWSRVDPNIEGDYAPIGGGAGIATVTEI